MRYRFELKGSRAKENIAARIRAARRWDGGPLPDATPVEPPRPTDLAGGAAAVLDFGDASTA